MNFQTLLLIDEKQIFEVCREQPKAPSLKNVVLAFFKRMEYHGPVALICLGLDFDPSTNKKLSTHYKGLASHVKLGPQNIFEEGPDIISYYVDQGFKVFLDFKFYDIPTTVGRVAKILKNVDIMTVHLAGGKPLLEEVKASNPHLKVAGVARLTSFNDETWENLGFSSKWPMEIRNKALSWPLDYFVMSGPEFEDYKGKIPAIIPGVRFKDKPTHDQARIAYLEDFIKIPSPNLLVLGRILKEENTFNFIKEHQCP